MDNSDEYDWMPLNTESLPQHPYPTPIPFSPIQPPAQATQYMSAPSASGLGSTAAPKVAIPRLARFDASLHGRRRSARACEPCRQRKTKCDGTRPSCGQCIYHNHTCSYEEVKRVRDQKRLGSLVKRVNAYEALLRDLESEVDIPTARRIKRELKVDEDLDRNEDTRAAGFFGKSLEANWIRKLESGVNMQSSQEHVPNSFYTDSHRDPASIQQQQSLERQIPTFMIDYHLDCLDIPLIEPCDPFSVPPRELADRYLDAYLINVHPTFSTIRKMTFISQYKQFFNNASTPPRKWLAVLNMIFAIGCRYCRLLDDPRSTGEEDLIYLTRARHLGLHSNVLFEHTDLQQIQLELLVAVYLLCLGQVNRASKFSNMALRSALSLGINLRLTDDRTKDAVKEARGRLWWSIYSLEHLLTSMTGRASCVSEGLCSVPAPLPYEEETFDHPEAKHLFQDPTLREAQLRSTLFESVSQHHSPSWVTSCPPCPSLFFNFLVDLTLITHALMNKVYSIEGLRKGPRQVEYHVQKFSHQMDRWLSKLPNFYHFTLSHPSTTPWHLTHPRLDDISTPFLRERVCLAMNYYSSRITLCRPCLTDIHQSTRYATPTGEITARGKLRLEMATNCLQASCALISILPEHPNMPWLAHAAPWWSILHFLMQATTALLLGLSYCSRAHYDNTDAASPLLSPATPSSQARFYPLLMETDLSTAIAATKKALSWLHTTAAVNPAARRAFLLCDGIVKKIAPGLGIDLSEWPDKGCFEGSVEGRLRHSSGDRNGNGTGNGENSGSYGHGSGSGMEAFEELIDFEGGVF